MYKKGLLAGAFELIHPGYIELFRDAKNICEFLVVALQDDPSMDRPKTKFKPVIGVFCRLNILKSIRYIDDVIPYRTEDDLVALIMEQRPDVRILGDDYIGKPITGKMDIPCYYHRRQTDWSTTKLRQLIAQSMKGR